MTTIQQAIEAAVKEFAHTHAWLSPTDKEVLAGIIKERVLPVVEGAEKIIAESLRELPVGYMPAHKPESIPGRIAELVRRYAETDRLEDEQDTALAKLAEARGLLKEASEHVSPVSHQGPTADELRAEYPEACALVDELRSRIDQFLSPSTQATEKTA